MHQETTRPSARPAAGAAPGGEYNRSIHGLRGVLALCVLVFHIADSGLPTFSGGLFDPLNYTLLSMPYAVDVFFGISGIVIVFAHARSRGPADFLINRATRILPVLWITTLLALALLVAAHRWPHPLSGPEFAATLGANLLALQPIVPATEIHPAAWSLSYEFSFYGLLTLWFLGAGRARWAARAAVITAAGALLFWHARGLLFVSGVAIAVAGARLNPRLAVLQFPGVCILGGMLAWHGAYDLINPAAPDERMAALAGHPEALGLFALGVVLASVGLAGVFLGNGRFSALLRTSALQWLGTISYSLYMWQAITLGVVKRVMLTGGLVAHLGPWAQLVFLLVVLAPTLLISWASQVWIEARLMRWLRARLKGRG